MVQKLRYIFSHKEKVKLVGLFVLILIGSFAELLGVSIFLPFIQVLMDQNAVNEDETLSFIYHTFHFGSVEQFLIALAIAIGK